MTRNSEAAVELAINCYERTYRTVLAPGFVRAVEAENGRSFARRIVLINNVDSPSDAAARAAALKERGEIDAAVSVAALLPRALERTGLSRWELGRIAYYSDFALVAVVAARCPWVLLWDAEIHLVAPGNWVDPALARFAADERILIANPGWAGRTEGGPRSESIELDGEFALGFGASDQVLLGRAAELASPIYGERALASLRYPTAHIAATFEQRIDAYMRTHGRLRATHRRISYMHPERGNDAYRPVSWIERMRRRRNRLVLKYLERSRSSDPTRRLYWPEPADDQH